MRWKIRSRAPIRRGMRPLTTRTEKLSVPSIPMTAYLLPPTHKVIEGRAGIVDFFNGLFSGGVTAHKLEIIEAGGDGKLVYGAAKWSATGKDDKGQPATFAGVATHVFEKQPDGSLKLKLQTFN